MNRNAIRTVALALPVLGVLLAGGSGAALAAGEAGGAAAATPLLLLAQADPGPPPPRAIREAQALLADLGYDPGPADGKWGRRTGKAYIERGADVDARDKDGRTPPQVAASQGPGTYIDMLFRGADIR